ncbi:MAG: type I methionyl aminopeptidase [Deltaproteobacteria bacterium]|nr:MAG: type I methionyl aminopeptidase [Deltaproteobacteria bacterium]
MRIPRLNKKQIDGMRRAGASAARTLHAACDLVAPGVTTQQIDDLVAAHTASEGGTCAQYLYEVDDQVFPAHVCTSVNEVVCHGIPGPRILRDGDIVNIDVTTNLDGWHGDTSRTVVVGKPTPEAAHVVQVASRALQVGIDAVRPGLRFNVIGEAIEAFVTSQGCTVVREFGGHGIGRRMHQAPHVHHHKMMLPQPVLEVGMCFTIEPMVCLGGRRIRMLDDGWTVITADGKLTAQAEHTVLVTADGAEILTRA